MAVEVSTWAIEASVHVTGKKLLEYDDDIR